MNSTAYYFQITQHVLYDVVLSTKNYFVLITNYTVYSHKISGDKNVKNNRENLLEKHDNESVFNNSGHQFGLWSNIISFMSGFVFNI